MLSWARIGVVSVTEAQRDAHHRVLMWSHVLRWQIARLREARRTFLTENEQALQQPAYKEEYNRPFYKMDAESTSLSPLPDSSCGR